MTEEQFKEELVNRGHIVFPNQSMCVAQINGQLLEARTRKNNNDIWEHIPEGFDVAIYMVTSFMIRYYLIKRKI